MAFIHGSWQSGIHDFVFEQLLVAHSGWKGCLSTALQHACARMMIFGSSARPGTHKRYVTGGEVQNVSSFDRLRSQYILQLDESDLLWP